MNEDYLLSLQEKDLKSKFVKYKTLSFYKSIRELKF